MYTCTKFMHIHRRLRTFSIVTNLNHVHLNIREHTSRPTSDSRVCFLASSHQSTFEIYTPLVSSYPTFHLSLCKLLLYLKIRSTNQ